MDFSPELVRKVVNEVSGGNLSLFQRITGFPKQRISRILKGSIPTAKTVGKLAMLTNRSVCCFYRHTTLNESATNLALREEQRGETT